MVGSHRERRRQCSRRLDAEVPLRVSAAMIVLPEQDALPQNSARAPVAGAHSLKMELHIDLDLLEVFDCMNWKKVVEMEVVVEDYESRTY